MCTIPEKLPNLSYRLATVADREDLRSALLRFFYPEEGLNVCYYGGSDTAPDDVEYYVSLIDEGFTELAIDQETGQIVGFSIGGLVEAHNFTNSLVKTEKFADILKLLEFMAKNANLAKRFGVTQIYSIYAVGVDPRYRQQGIATALMENQFEKARKSGAALVSADTTGIKSAGLVKKLGMEVVFSIAFNDYRDEVGRQIFVSSDSELAVQTVVKRF